MQEISTVMGFLNHGVLVAEGTQKSLRKAINEATGGRAATFTVTETRLEKIAKEVKEELTWRDGFGGK